jgi:Zn-dependent protease with chaperone function
VRFYLFGLLLLVSAIIGGCAAQRGTSSEWVRQAGGVVVDAQQQRVETVVARLVGDDPELRLKIHVLATDAVCAFAWPNGTVYVTRGLVDRADDDVLAAAVAHEIGHLLSDGRVRSVASLKGCDKNADAEGRADAYGVALLRTRHMSTESMARMLRLVRDSNQLSPDGRRAMDDRIGVLTAPSVPGQN